MEDYWAASELTPSGPGQRNAETHDTHRGHSLLSRAPAELLSRDREFTGEPQRQHPSTPSFLTSCHSSTRPQSPRNKQIQSAGFWAAGQPHSRASHLPITSRAPALPHSIPYHVRENNPPPSPKPRLGRTKLRQLRTDRSGSWGGRWGFSGEGV